MAQGFRIEIDGLRDLEKALMELPKTTAGNVIKRSVTRAAAIIADDAVALAPIDEGVLKKEIKVSPARIISPGKAAFAAAMRAGATRAEAGAAAHAANAAAGGSGKAAISIVGPTKRAGHGILQEFGTRHHAAQPFMRPAWDRKAETAARAVKDILKDEIDKAVARIARKAAREAAKLKAGAG